MKHFLPASPRDLAGLRARRYVRVSSEEQGAKYGPERQHQDTLEAIERLGLVEAGEPFVDEQSAWSRSDERPELLRLTAAAAAGDFDVLVVAYFSRWSRDTEVALRIRRELHAVGVVLYFVDESFLSSDADQHERFLQEATAAEIFSLRLSRTITKTLRTKFDRYGDQAGSAGLGFMRTPQPEARLVIDPAVMPRVVALFERYAVGDVSYRELAKVVDVREGALRGILTNPLYNGWARRHRRSADEQLVPAPWRSAPPVSDELWARVAEVRSRRLKNGGGHPPARAHLLAKLMVCTCGRGVPADTVSVPGRATFRRYRHEDCDRWSQQSRKAAVFEAPIAAQISSLRLDEATLARIKARADRVVVPDNDVRRRQIEADLRSRAAAHAARRLTTEAYLAEHERLSAELDSLDAASRPGRGGDGEAVVAALRSIAKAWEDASPEARAALARQIYRRILVEDDRILEVELTPSAKALGFMEALPERVRVMGLARPARARHPQSTVRIPIVGREAWLRAVRSA